MKKIFTALVTMLAVMIFSISNVNAANDDWATNNYIEVVGMGMAPPNAVNATHGKMLARRAAIADGYRQIAEVIKGVSVESGTNVEMMMLQSTS